MAVSNGRRLRFLGGGVACAVIAAGIVAVLAGRGSAPASGAPPTVATAGARPPVVAATLGDLQVQDPVARVTLADSSAMYFAVKSAGAADALVGVTCDGVGSATLHDSVVEGASASMKQVARIGVPAGGRVSLEAGGLHVMLERLSRPLVAGETLRCTLQFERAGIVSLSAPVRNYGE